MGKLGLITGATSGIGKAYSELLAKNGWDLIITGRRAEIINKHAKKLQLEYNVDVQVVIVDFFDKESYEKFITNYVKKYKDRIGFLINNVGFSNRNNFFNTDFPSNHRMIDAHISKLTEITHYIVNGMKTSGGGKIVNVSSLVGFLPSLHDPFYSGSKSFISTYSESIALILKDDNILVQSLCPGFTRTDFHKNMVLKEGSLKNRGLKRWMQPEDVAEYSYKKLKKGRVIVIPGLSNRIVYNFVKFMPKRLYYKFAGLKRVL